MSKSRAPFPGNHVEKQAARMFLYRFVLDAPVQGHAVTLAGPEPIAELKLLRDYVRWPGHRTWFVDKDVNNPKVVRALRQIKKEWPEAHAEGRDLRKLLPALGAIGFANLDFMGWPLQRDNWDCFEQVAQMLLPGAVVGFTWLRGREQLNTQKSARLLWKLGKGYRGNERRWAGFLNAVEQVDRKLRLLDRWQYLSNHSPMSVAVFRKE